MCTPLASAVLYIPTTEKGERGAAVVEGYRPSRVPTSKMNLAPSLRYRASVAGSRPSDWDGVCAKSFLSQYQHGLMWSRLVM